MIRAHVYGASGYAGAELIRLLARHPYVQLGALASRTNAGEAVGTHFAHLRGLALAFSQPDEFFDEVASGDAVFFAADSGVAADAADGLLSRGAAIVDLSADFRLSGSHSEAVYGFPERYRAAIADARLVANPGCYPTASLLAIGPLAEFSADITAIVVDAKSGITGAGRTPAVPSLFASVDGDVRAYGLQGHRHLPELRQELGGMGFSAPIVFTPHVVPVSRGLLADVYCVFSRAPDRDAVHAAFWRAYDGNPFVRVLAPDVVPCLPGLVGTNDAEIHVGVEGNVVRAICGIDNLGKGAAGQAVQNLNIMCGFAQETGLHDCAIAG